MVGLCTYLPTVRWQPLNPQAPRIGDLAWPGTVDGMNTDLKVCSLPMQREHWRMYRPG